MQSTPTNLPLSPTTPVAQLVFGDLESELAITRRTLARFPEGHADWRPHEKSTPLGRLAVHVATLPDFAKAVLQSDELDLAERSSPPRPFRTAADLVAIFDEAVRQMWPVVNAASFDTLNGAWRLRTGPQVIVEGKRGPLIRQMMINHIVHHRAQLGVYYRLLGIPVPAVYGPSADES
jgi:hypothetical protein